MQQAFRYPDGIYASEAPMAPRPGATAEDDGHVLTFVTDVARIADGPVARIRLPARIASGTHACWAPGETLRSPS